VGRITTRTTETGGGVALVLNLAMPIPPENCILVDGDIWAYTTWL
jgi:hypothetical protein